MDQIGMRVILDDKDFQAGLSRYVEAQQRMQRVTEQAWKAIGVTWNEAAQRFQSSAGKFVPTAEVETRLKSLQEKVAQSMGAITQNAQKTANAVQQAGKKLSWNEFTAQRMGPYMQQYGGHAGAIRKIAEEWKAYKAGAEQAAPASQHAASGLDKVGQSAGNAARGLSTMSIALGAAVGTFLGNIATKGLDLFLEGIHRVVTAIPDAINKTRAWGGQVDDLTDIFGVSDDAATGMAAALSHVGLSVDEGAQAFRYFVRNIQVTKDQMKEAGSGFAETAMEIRKGWTRAQAEAIENTLQAWADFRLKRVELESELSDQIAGINESLQDRLDDIARERGDIERDLTKSLTKLDSNMKDRLRHARGRERREIRKDWKEQRQELMEQAQERREVLNRQETEARKQAAKQIALAEKVAQKQIDAAEKAAQKQVEAIEKALKKEQEARDENLKKAQQAIGKSANMSPLAKGLSALGLTLRDVTDDAGEFNEKGLALIMDRFAALPKGVKASAIAIDLFGRAGLQWLDFLRLGSKGLDEWRKKGLALGLGVNTDEIKEFNQAVNDVNLSMLGLTITMGKEFMPVVKQFMDWFMKEGVPFAKSFLNAVSEGFKADGLKGAFEAIKIWKNQPANKALIDSAIQEVSQVLSKLWTDFIGTVLFVGSALRAMFDAVSAWAAEPQGQAYINYAVVQLGTYLARFLTAFVKTSVEIVKFLGELAGRVVEWAQKPENQQYFKNMASAFINGFSKAMSEELTKNPLPWMGWFTNLPSYNIIKKMMGFQQGGWVPQTGPALVHAGEYVLNRQQARVMAPMLSNNYSRSYSVTVPQTFYGQQSSVDLQRIKQSSYEGTMRAIRDAANKA